MTREDDTTYDSRRNVLRTAAVIGTGAVGLTGVAAADEHGEFNNGRRRDEKRKHDDRRHYDDKDRKKHRDRKDRNGRHDERHHHDYDTRRPDPVTDTDGFVEYVKRMALRSFDR
ncbi:hypothetical protein EL22_15985 [Halostagnicola sp. A56]|uniref:hypothetical protein n=1 Tax=Halostagnicola sp. A56 TaxID=1495067 RepID=UPI0004A09478|nr:hypothetical protein [Halostagnicola sp. A56]KDE60592.1 hypothetical protein EL22_15985 [Halostagnicola sp. A56]